MLIYQLLKKWHIYSKDTEAMSVGEYIIHRLI